MAQIDHTTSASLVEKAAATVGVGGSLTSSAFGLSTSEWQAIGVLGGLIVAAMGFAFNAWLAWRRDQREAERRG